MSERPYILFCDNTCDLPAERLEKMDCRIIPLTFEIDGESVSSDEISMPDFYARMRADAATKTSQINVDSYLKAFGEVLEEGCDILYLAFSSGLSGSYNSALIARTELLEKYPDARIEIVDSLAASAGEGLMLIYAEQKKREGMGLDELAKWIEDNRLSFGHVFTVDDLKYLFRGGRVSRAAAIAGTMLGIKPVLHVDDEGHLIPLGKVRGRKQSIKKLGEMIRERCGDVENPIVAISHGDCIDDANAAADMMKEIFGKKTEVVITYVGPVIGSHAGSGTLALFFRADHR